MSRDIPQGGTGPTPTASQVKRSGGRAAWACVEGGRMRPRGRAVLVVGVVATTALLAAGGLAGCGRSGGAVSAGGPLGEGSWRSLPDSPLSPRLGATTIWTGTELLVFGGEDPIDHGTSTRSEERRVGEGE